MSGYDEPAKLRAFGRDEAKYAIEIGRRLAFFRKEIGLSQPQVARALDMHQSKVAKLELGQQRLMMHDDMAFSMIYRVDLSLLDPRTPFDERRPYRRPRRDGTAVTQARHSRRRSDVDMSTSRTRPLHARKSQWTPAGTPEASAVYRAPA